MAVGFELHKSSGQTKARLGSLHTPHGEVQTPAFMPVGTQATVKHLSSAELSQLGFQLILSNTYHLELRPGSERIKDSGGLHQFMNWEGAILTDSGGYQVMSLADIRTLDDSGVTFKSHLDGSEMFLSPEKCIEVQARFGVDIIMALDECPPYPSEREEVVKAMERTHTWALRCLDARVGDQAIFGIVQGGWYPELRTESAHFVRELPFDGFAIGGVSVGEPTEIQYPVVTHTAPLLPENKPRYLMGVGHPQDIIHAVSCGVDMFDCVLPTRLARHHGLYTLQGRVNLRSAKWREWDAAPDPSSQFPELKGYSAAYLHHLFRAKEPLGARLATLHNLRFYARLMEEIREAIASDTWDRLVERYRHA
ncbi:MAG: tRNA guanosine(34) transglycosylase Tgt [Fimbriimonadaceae bacterium]